MISRFRMKVDTLGQLLIVVALLLLWILDGSKHWTNYTFILLFCWQLASAFHLWLAYQHLPRRNYLLTALVMGISLPLWIQFVGNFAYLPVAGLALWHFGQSIHDTIVVYRRPRPFWDL